MDDDSPEGLPLRGNQIPVAPSKEIIESHRLSGHYPPRMWCKNCVEGWMKEDQHRQIKDQNEIPLIAFDYARTKPGI